MLLNLNWLVSHFDYPLQNANILDIVTARQDFIPAKMDVKVPYSLQRETLQVMMRFAFINQLGASIDVLSMFGKIVLKT